MFEILDRGGLGRTGLWSRGGASRRTPLILSVHRASRLAPPYAEALLVTERTTDPRFQLRVSGTLFAPRPPESPDDLPPSKGLPISVADLEVPQAPTSGDLAVITSEADLEAARTAEVAVLANGVEYLRSPRGFVAAVTRIRRELGPSVLVGVTGLAAPTNLAALVYLGVDIVDSSRMVLDSARDVFHTADRIAPVAEVDREACACPACIAGEDLLAHNERALYRELLVVRNHIVHGRLRELVEGRLANDPWNTAVLRHLDLRHGELLEEYTPVAGGELLAYSYASLHRPEVVRFRRRIRERYAKPASAKVLLLLPCSARKPYSSSRSHRRFREAVLASGNPSVVHEVIVTSPLGLVPRELERFYPAGAYDIPVTGDWSRDEAAVVLEDLRAFVEANRYDAVVAHLGGEAGIVREALPTAVFPSEERPASEEALRALSRALAEAAAAHGPVARGRRFAEEMQNIARFQFGSVGAVLSDGATFRGRFPRVRTFLGGVQVAMHTERGMLSLSLDGGRLLSKAAAYCVEIDDFVPKGNVFAVGVTGASPDIRVGDDVVVRYREEVRAVGTARMNAREMIDAARGEAVHVRHVVESAPAS